MTKIVTLGELSQVVIRKLPHVLCTSCPQIADVRGVLVPKGAPGGRRERIEPLMTEQIATEPVPTSDYERIGGGAAVRSVVQSFYESVLEDPELAGIFVGVDMNKLKRHQVQLISHVLGGPVEYEGRDLRVAHAGLSIRPSQFAAVVAHLVAALREADVPTDVVERVVAALAGSEPDVVTAGD